MGHACESEGTRLSLVKIKLVISCIIVTGLSKRGAMKDDDENENFHDFSQEGDEDVPSLDELAVWLSDFMSQSQKARTMYRSHYCHILASKVWDEFGIEGMCELMMAIDKKAGWISDILIEDADIHDALFTTFGIYDNDAIIKARMSREMLELNKKIWRLRKKYSKLIAEEIVNGVETAGEN